MPVIAERTRHVTGLATRRGGSGDPSPFTAIGVEAAIEHAVRSACSASPLAARPHDRGRRASATSARALARLLRAGGRAARASPTSTSASARSPSSSAPAGRRRRRALTAKVDVLSPCALGGVLDADDRAAAALPRDRRRGQQPAHARSASPTCSRRAGSCGRPTSSSTPAGSSTSRSSCAPGGYDAADRAPRLPRDRRRRSPRCSTPPRRRRHPARRRQRAGGAAARPCAAAHRRGARHVASRSRQPRRAAPAAPRPSGSRPSSASLSRCAASVTVAAGRSSAGASAQAASSSSSTLRAPRGERVEQRRSRSRRCATYSSSFAAGSSTSGPWPGQISASVARAQPREPGEVAGERARVGRDEDAARRRAPRRR